MVLWVASSGLRSFPRQQYANPGSVALRVAAANSEIETSSLDQPRLDLVARFSPNDLVSSTALWGGANTRDLGASPSRFIKAARLCVEKYGASAGRMLLLTNKSKLKVEYVPKISCG